MAQTAEKPQTIHEEIEAHRKNGSNLLIPFTKLEGNEFYQPVIDEVFLKVDQGDAYKRQGAYGDRPAKYALSLQGLTRLAVCAGVQWHPYETRRIDPANDRYYIAFQAVGGIRKADGSMVWHKASYDLDLEVVKEEIEENHRKRINGWKKRPDNPEKLVQEYTTRDWRQKRRHKHALAESGAKARVLRSLLNVKNLYTQAELQKPFVVIRYIFQPPTNDPAVRRQLIDQSIAAMQSVYGTSSPSLPYYPEKDDYIDIPPPEEATEAPPDESDLEPDPFPEDKSPSPEPDPEAGPAPKAAADQKGQGSRATSPEQAAGQDDRLKEFLGKTKAKQLVEITRLAREIGYNLVAVQSNEGVRIDQLSDEQRLELYKDIISHKK